jgi:CRISPR-associated protein (TIGR02584 family)
LSELVFIATLGQRAEAITVALDRLLEQYKYVQACIIHTQPQLSGIGEALTGLHLVLDKDYPDLHITYHELLQRHGTPLIDIIDRESAMEYHRAVLTVLSKCKTDGYTVHLLIAGGRKAMSVYATLAASLVFGARDRVWTVLSPDEMLSHRGMYHIPPGLKDQVQVIDLPLIPARIVPGSDPSVLLEDPEEVIHQRQDIRADFLRRLSKQERVLAKTLEEHPYATNEELANMLNKSPRTVENQFRAVYAKLVGYLDFTDELGRKRQALLDILQGRV